MSESGVGTGRLRDILAALVKVRSSHVDWTGYLVHRRDVTDSEIEYDDHCPACVIKKVRQLVEAALAAAPPAAGGTIGLDGDTQRCCNAPGCDNPWPCFIHPESAPPASVTLCHKMITPETSCELDKGHEGECSPAPAAVTDVPVEPSAVGSRMATAASDPSVDQFPDLTTLISKMRERASENSRHHSLYIRGAATGFGLCADWLEDALGRNRAVAIEQPSSQTGLQAASGAPSSDLYVKFKAALKRATDERGELGWKFIDEYLEELCPTDVRSAAVSCAELSSATSQTVQTGVAPSSEAGAQMKCNHCFRETEMDKLVGITISFQTGHEILCLDCLNKAKKKTISPACHCNDVYWHGQPCPVHGSHVRGQWR